MKPIAKQELSFWLTLTALNVLLFLPAFLLGFQAGGMAPPSGRSAEAVGGLWPWLVLWADGLRSVRINAEVLIIAAAWAHFRFLRGLTGRLVASTLYLVALAYYVYEGVVQSLYGEVPNFFSHFLLARDGLPFLFSNLNLPVAVYIAAGGLSAGILWLLSSLLDTVNSACQSGSLGRTSRATVAAMAVAVFLSALIARPAQAGGESAASSMILEFQRNIQRSWQLHRSTQDFASLSYKRVSAIGRHHLLRKPNVYLIFVESYGGVLLRRPDFEEAYEKLTSELGDILEQEGWLAASSLSESPTWGGGSWMAYSSALFGTRIDEHPEYLKLLDEYSEGDRPYPGLPKYLQEEGYTTLWLSPIAKELEDEVWEQYRTFYSIDIWLRHRDFNYQGRQYGWGPAPPDQYVLEYARAEYVRPSEQPVFLMFVTQNSHFPYHVPELVDDWRTLNVEPPADDAPQSEDVNHQQLRANYMDAIAYELRMLTEYVLNTGEEDALFVLVGDHQPPRVSRRDDSYDTPIHVISRDAETTDFLVAQGFVAGMLPAGGDSLLGHEEIYALLADVLRDMGKH